MQYLLDFSIKRKGGSYAIPAVIIANGTQSVALSSVLSNSLAAIALYVSHNLPEAFLMADRIAIMLERKIIQLDNPLEIRLHPANQFVKDFIKCFEIDSHLFSG